MDASSFRKRTAYALGASEDEDLTGANSGPKLMRHTGVGSGLLNRSPKGVSKHMDCESTHTDTAWCSASHMYFVCGQKGSKTMLSLFIRSPETALCSHACEFENGGLTKLTLLDDQGACKPFVLLFVGHGSCKLPC